MNAIFDASSVYARAYYAVDGDATRTVPLMVRMVCHQLELFARASLPADRLLFCWDGMAKRAKPRAAKPAAYHEGRLAASAKLETIFGAAQAWPPEAEGDDAVATAAYRSEAAGDAAIVVSSDKDLHQLVGERVLYWCTHAKGFLSRETVVKRWQVKRPSQVAIALAILGDPGDAVPGIKGWGPKKVGKVFAKVTEEMGFAAALDAVTDQIPADLQPVFFESLDLTLLDPGVPGIPDPTPVRLVDPNRDDLGEAYATYLKIYARYTGVSVEDRMLEQFDNPDWLPVEEV